ncbi:alpha/beta fold hydrolase [Nocardioides jishulii]|uniref:Alpha/beta hydrolase n=1 Tax=Nocardioides jishulii TaxID=2575440 RepID=A0A4U2YU80_9ACTN|nr:alpha/beta hydrolase [Nocardioides jishulii]QCX28367.1 alpha/beta hydrolase [Nocardioides jishulii]TKI64740.1 alpha/beta hydrolase [Nocardioides jishulii]
MSRSGKALGVAAGLVGVAAAGATARAVQQVKARPGAGDDTPFGSLRSPSLKVVTDDGIDLHVEVDEPDEGHDNGLTIIFVHGFTLSLQCWHFQRAAYRGLVRTVFYDQRSHGESARSDGDNCTIDQLGRDLKRVIETTAPGPVVLVGHSMGGMSVISLAAQFPELFGDKVVGTALIGTTAGGLDAGRILFPMLPLGSLGGRAVGRMVRVLDRGHSLVDRARATGFRLAEIVVGRFAFGEDVPINYSEFVFDMIDDTPFEVVADFYPSFASLDHYDNLSALGRVPCTVIAGTLDKMTGVGHSRKLHSRIPGSELLEVDGAGHMVLMERHDEVNAELDHLFERALAWAQEHAG